MQRLLSLPPELRLQIYRYALSDQHLEVDVSEYWSDRDPKFWERMAEPLAQIDLPLALDIRAIHWSRVEIVYSEHMWNSVSTADQKFVFWLFYHANAVKHILGTVRFIEVTDHWGTFSRCLRKDSCVACVDIDLRRGTLSIMDSSMMPCNCDHANSLRPLMTKVLDQIPRGHGRLHPRISDLWDLYEAWRLQYYLGPDSPRPWADVRLSYAKVFRCRDPSRTEIDHDH